MGPPRKSGTNVGLLIGLGCGGLALIGILLVVIFAVAADGDAETTSAEATATSEVDEPPPPTEPVGEGKLEMEDLRIFRARNTGKLVYVIGELVNNGSAPINSPRAKITVFDRTNTALDSTVCGAFVVRDLQPGEKVPCFSVMSKASGFTHQKVEPEFSKSFGSYRAAELKISEVESTSPRGVFGAHKVTGKVTNESPFVAKNVWVIVGLYGKDGKIVGSGKTLVAGNDLAPGASGKFTVSIYNVAEQPTRSLTKVFGYDK